MFSRPFVFLSEALVARPDVLSVARSAGTLRVDPQLFEEVWSSTSFTPRAQAAFFRDKSTSHGERLQKWLADAADQVSELVEGDRTVFKRNFIRGMLSPDSYTVPVETAEFLRVLESREINWGIIANESRLYPSIVKKLGLKPFKIILGRDTVFKPLPSVLRRAIGEVPRASRHAVWFIGSANRPCDNLASAGLAHIALVTGSALHKKEHVTKESGRDLPQRISIASVLDVLPLLQPTLDSSWMEASLEEPEDLVDAVMLAPRPPNPILPLGVRECGLVDSTDMKLRKSN